MHKKGGSKPLPAIGRIADGALRLDLRCLSAADEAAFLGQLAQLAMSNP
jgi:L-seryl-tRNA(Ser) seleniumtransferase